MVRRRIGGVGLRAGSLLKAAGVFMCGADALGVGALYSPNGGGQMPHLVRPKITIKSPNTCSNSASGVSVGQTSHLVRGLFERSHVESSGEQLRQLRRSRRCCFGGGHVDDGHAILAGGMRAHLLQVCALSPPPG
eukprot:1194909-Prorocentrum_minimum.AAC.3